MRTPRMLTAGLLVVLVAGPGCWFFKKKVDPKDCDKFAEHYKEAMQAWVDDKMEGCKGKTPELKKSLKKTWKSNVDDSGDTLFSTCKSLSGVSVLDEAEASCFMKGKSPEDWKKCGFSNLGALYSFGVSADAQAKGLKGTCGGDDGGDDDDDKPKKKKSKKSDDD